MNQNIALSEEDLAQMDAGVIPLVKYFNSVGLKTYMSCEGHGTPNMSFFWIEFHKSVNESDIAQFMQRHLNRLGAFASNGRFVNRMLYFGGKNPLDSNGGNISHAWMYITGTVESAMEDLSRWMADDAK